MARVLVVDDSAWMRRMLSDALTKGGHEVVGEASNGADALVRYRQVKPDLTTLDITMPRRDGLDALKDIIASDPSATVLMCSALGQDHHVLEALKSGASDFVVKPFESGRLLDAVARAVA